MDKQYFLFIYNTLDSNPKLEDKANHSPIEVIGMKIESNLSVQI